MPPFLILIMAILHGDLQLTTITTIAFILVFEGAAMSLPLIILSYLIGSIPFSLLLVRWTKGVDLRQFGSGNIGATNARRAAGTGLGIVALLGDALKGALPVSAVHYLAKINPDILPQWLAGVVAVAAIAGHIYPIYFKFKPSGKGVATTIGSFLVLSPLAVGTMVVVLILVVVISRRVSLGSLAGIISLPPAIWVFYREPVLLVCSLLVTVAILLRHKDNIRRIRHGNEPIIGRLRLSGRQEKKGPQP